MFVNIRHIPRIWLSFLKFFFFVFFTFCRLLFNKIKGIYGRFFAFFCINKTILKSEPDF